MNDNEVVEFLYGLNPEDAVKMAGARKFRANREPDELPEPGPVTIRYADGSTNTRPMTRNELKAWLESEGIDAEGTERRA